MSNGTSSDAGTTPSNASQSWSLDRILLAIALFGGVSGSTVGLLGSQDRFYGSEGRALQTEITTLKESVRELKSDFKSHDDDSKPTDELRHRIRMVELAIQRLETEMGHHHPSP